MRVPDWVYCKLGFHEYETVKHELISGRFKSIIPFGRGLRVTEYEARHQRCRHCDTERYTL